MIGEELLFFIYSKAAILNYCKSKIDKFSRLKEKNLSNNLIQTATSFLASNYINTPQIMDKTLINKKNKKRIHTNTSLNQSSNIKIKEDRLNSVYSFENILPPNPESIFNKDSDNILDDLIESSNNKFRINSKSLLFNSDK
jgi:hypothetical protein